MPALPIICYGVSRWNRPTLGALLTAELGGPVTFVDDFNHAFVAARRSGGTLAAWASKLTPMQDHAACSCDIPLVRVEDGFLRSVGLGAGLTRGGSYVIDRLGIYYDARQPSDIEALLESAEVDAEACARAADLRQAIVSARLTKYNVGRRELRLDAPAGRPRVLVVGQVADDAGVRRTLSSTIDCSTGDNINLDLLERTRAEFPDAYIVYKPHPDVAAGLRRGAVPSALLSRLADQVVADADIVALIEETDWLVTLSSLAGFEALLRGKPVTVHGLPFYAGWGLTDDRTVSPRRTRRRSLDELVALSLLAYARYVDPVTLQPVSPEQLIARLATQRLSLLHRLGTRLRQHVSWAGRRIGL